jgi:hypothetical protein
MALYASPTTGISLAGTDLSSLFSVGTYNNPYTWYKIFNIKPPAAVGWFKTSLKNSDYNTHFGKKGDVGFSAWTPELRRRYTTIVQTGITGNFTTHNPVVYGSPGNRLQDFKISTLYTQVGNAAIWTALANVPLNDAGTLGTMAVGTYYGNFLYHTTTNNIVTREPGFAFTNFSDEATITLQPFVKYAHTDAARQHSFRLYRDGSVIQTQPGTTNAVTVTQTYNFSNITISPNSTSHFRVDGSILTGTGADYLYLQEFGFNVISYA